MSSLRIHGVGRIVGPRFTFPVILAASTMYVSACDLSAERIAPFETHVVSVTVDADTSTVDLTEFEGVIIFDRECDGFMNDTLPIFGDDAGLITGIIRYEAPIENSTPFIRKAVNIKFDSLGIDTFLNIDAHLHGESDHIDIENWGYLIAKRAPREVMDSARSDK